LVLSGLLPISEDVIDKIVITSNKNDEAVTLLKLGNTWTLNNQKVFQNKLDAFWSITSYFEGAQLTSKNKNKHSKIGLDDIQGVNLEFFVGNYLQEKFILGKWTNDSRLCYFRKPGKSEVYSTECPVPADTIFDTNILGWQDPTILSVPKVEISEIQYIYETEEFKIVNNGNEQIIISQEGNEFAQWIPVNTIFQTLSGFISSGFANKEEAISLQLQEPFATIKIKTIDDSSNKSMTLKFLQKDDKSYYVYITGSPTVYILEKAIGDLILLNKSQLTD
tara:strand:- start:2731 stop:3564 length:834 start_codon:yes stop_codon:yes gene_type:complete